MQTGKLAKGDKFTDVQGSWQVIQVHPPLGKRRRHLYTILNLDTMSACMVEELELFAKENNLQISQD